MIRVGWSCAALFCGSSCFDVLCVPRVIANKETNRLHSQNGCFTPLFSAQIVYDRLRWAVARPPVPFNDASSGLGHDRARPHGPDQSQPLTRNIRPLVVTADQRTPWHQRWSHPVHPFPVAPLKRRSPEKHTQGGSGGLSRRLSYGYRRLFHEGPAVGARWWCTLVLYSSECTKATSASRCSARSNAYDDKSVAHISGPSRRYEERGSRE